MGEPTPHDSMFSRHDIEEEVLLLRRNLLQTLLILTFCLGWVSYPASVFLGWGAGTGGAIGITLLLGTSASYQLTRKPGSARHRLGCWILITSATAAHALFAATRHTCVAKVSCLPLIIATNALVGWRGALAIAVASWILGNVVVPPDAATPALCCGSVTGLLVLNLATAGISIMTTGTLTISAEWALNGWARAARALAETRERRAELYRAVRALDEASYRIQRMNDELVSARREAELASAIKARFAAMLSHELRGPLNLILGYSKMMALSPENYSQALPADYRADVTTIYRSSQHLTSLLDDVLDLARIEAERLPLVREPVDLEEDVVKAAVRVVEPLARRKGLHLRTELHGSLPTIVADAVRLRQVLLNLLTNALRFTDTGGILVMTGQHDDHVLVTVSDTGTGIPEKDLPHLFQEFTQIGPGGRGGVSDGSGLGLVISKQLVELHGGRIWAESKQGQGTTFSFTIPLPGGRPAVGTTVSTRQSRDSQQGERTCLVVRQSAEVVRLLARYTDDCRIVGASVHGLSDLIEQLHPMAILTDQATATAVVEQLGSADYDVPVVSWKRVRHAAHGAEPQVTAYVMKPISSEIIQSVMRQLERDGETTILVVDDDRDAVRLLENVLRSLPRPYRILHAYDGASALSLMHQSRPDVVFIDLLMPGLSGGEVIAAMREDDRLRETAVIVTSALDPVSVEVGIECPITVYRKGYLGIREAAKCLRAIIHELQPDYLGQEPSEGCEATRLG